MSETVKAKHTATQRLGVVEYDFGDDLAAMITLFGEEVVHSNAKQSMRITLQARMRNDMDYDDEGDEEPITDEVLQANATAWKPGVASATRKTPAEKAREALGKLSESERAELLASINAMDEDEEG